MKTITEQQWQKIFKIRDNFIFDIFNESFDECQTEFSNKIIQSVILNKGKTLCSEWTRQSGKTTVVVLTVIFLLLSYFQICKMVGIKTTQQFNVGFFAPQLDQARSAYNMLRNYLRKCEGKGFDFTFDTFNGNTITMLSKTLPPRIIYCMTASPTSRQESKTLNLIIFDESQDLEDKVVNKAIRPMGANTNATTIFIGVAGYKKCQFYHYIEQLEPEQKIIVPFDRVIKARRKKYEETGNDIYLNYEKHIEERKFTLGENSDEFKTQYKMEWVLERGQFITYDELMKLEQDYSFLSGNVYPFFAGIDWGKASDSTVFTIINEYAQIVEWFEWQGDDYASQIEEIAAITQMYPGLKTIHCDSTGNQDMAVDILRRKVKSFGVVVNAVNFNPNTKDEMYKNLWRLMHDTISGGHVIQQAPFKFPTKDSQHKAKFVKQMLDLQKEIKNDKWRCNHPAGPGYHDDYCDSLALACLAFTPKKQNTYRPTVYL